MTKVIQDVGEQPLVLHSDVREPLAERSRPSQGSSRSAGASRSKTTSSGRHSKRTRGA